MKKKMVEIQNAFQTWKANTRYLIFASRFKQSLKWHLSRSVLPPPYSCPSIVLFKHWQFVVHPGFLFMLIYLFIEKCTSKQGPFDHLHLDFPTNWHHVSAVSGFRLHHKATKDPAQKVPSSIIPTFSNNARPQQQIQHVKKQNEITR